MATTVLLDAITEMQATRTTIEKKSTSLTFLLALPFSAPLLKEIAKLHDEMQELDTILGNAILACNELLGLGYPNIPTDAVPQAFLNELVQKIHEIEDAESVFKALVVGPPVSGMVRWSPPHS